MNTSYTSPTASAAVHQGRLILLIQFSTGSPGNFFEYNSTAELFDGICMQYEKGLRLSITNPQMLINISYDFSDLTAFMDALPQLRVHVHKGNAWQELDREWIKRGLSNHLKVQATP